MYDEIEDNDKLTPQQQQLLDYVDFLITNKQYGKQPEPKTIEALCAGLLASVPQPDKRFQKRFKISWLTKALVTLKAGSSMDREQLLTLEPRKSAFVENVELSTLAQLKDSMESPDTQKKQEGKAYRSLYMVVFTTTLLALGLLVIILVTSLASQSVTSTTLLAAVATPSPSESKSDLSYPKANRIVLEEKDLWPQGRPPNSTNLSITTSASNDDYLTIIAYYNKKLVEMGYTIRPDPTPYNCTTNQLSGCVEYKNLIGVKSGLLVTITVASPKGWKEQAKTNSTILPNLFKNLKDNQTLIIITIDSEVVTK